MKSVEPSGNEHRRPELSKEHAADPYATLQNGSLGQNVIDVLFGFARRDARVAQNDVRMEEMMTAIGLTRARIRLEKGVHLDFHYSVALACFASGASQQDKPAAILLTTTHRLPFFVTPTITAPDGHGVADADGRVHRPVGIAQHLAR
jgi:hypothetical protein